MSSPFRTDNKEFVINIVSPDSTHISLCIEYGVIFFHVIKLSAPNCPCIALFSKDELQVVIVQINGPRDDTIVIWSEALYIFRLPCSVAVNFHA